MSRKLVMLVLVVWVLVLLLVLWERMIMGMWVGVWWMSFFVVIRLFGFCGFSLWLIRMMLVFVSVFVVCSGDVVSVMLMWVVVICLSVVCIGVC